MKEPSSHFNSRSVLIVVLMLIVVLAVVFGIDLINGRWDEPLIQPQPLL